MKAAPREKEQRKDLHATMLHDPVAKMFEKAGEFADNQDSIP